MGTVQRFLSLGDLPALPVHESREITLERNKISDVFVVGGEAACQSEWDWQEPLGSMEETLHKTHFTLASTRSLRSECDLNADCIGSLDHCVHI
jgi:hypothetical protein